MNQPAHAVAEGAVGAIGRLFSLALPGRQMLYAEGHPDLDRFVAACRRVAPLAPVDPTKCRHVWMWLDRATNPEAAARQGEFTAVIEDEPRRGRPVTICDQWLDGCTLVENAGGGAQVCLRQG
jgi:hypothetical protein